MYLPRIPEGQVYLVYAESATGIILNKDGSYNTSSSQEYYEIFENIEVAKQFIKENYKEGKAIEVLIYNHEKKFISQYNCAIPFS